MRKVLALVMVMTTSGMVRAQDATTEATAVDVRAGLGIGRYSEHAYGFEFYADIQPTAVVAVEAAFPTGRGFAIVHGDVEMGSDVAMRAKTAGTLTQTNRFEQEIYGGGVRYRWLGSHSMFYDLGYRFGFQRLHFRDIRDPQGNPRPITGANEDVMLHAAEAALGWRRRNVDGSVGHLAFGIGLNRGWAFNDVIEGEDFAAMGLSFSARGTHRFASGLQLGGEAAWRQQNGTSLQDVTLMGAPYMAFWPKSTTWHLLALVGYGF